MTFTLVSVYGHDLVAETLVAYVNVTPRQVEWLKPDPVY